MLSTKPYILLVPNPLFPMQRHLGQFYIFGVTVFEQKTNKHPLKTLLNGQSHQPEVPALTFQEEMKLWPQIPYSLIPQLLTMCHDGPNLHQQRFLGL